MDTNWTGAELKAQPESGERETPASHRPALTRPGALCCLALALSSLGLAGAGALPKESKRAAATVQLQLAAEHRAPLLDLF